MQQIHWTNQGVPVLGVAGPSGSGKTTLLEALIPRLANRGLRVGVLKHARHELRMDAPGTDTSRLYTAGAAMVIAEDARQLAIRRALSDVNDWPVGMEAAPPDLDLLLVEGYRDAPIARISVAPDPHVSGVFAQVGSDVKHAESVVCDWLAAVWALRPWGALRLDDCRAVPEAASGLAWELPPVPGVPWPLSLLLAAMRWRPDSAWIIAPTTVDESALGPLLNARTPGMWLIGQPSLFLVEPQLHARAQLLASRKEPVADVVDLLESLQRKDADCGTDPKG